MMWRKKSGGSPAGPSLRYEDEGDKVPRGHVPMVTGCGERVLVPVRLLAAASIAELLDMAAESFGYGQPGVLRVLCDGDHFRRVVDSALQRAG
jgi:hypothetical protein